MLWTHAAAATVALAAGFVGGWVTQGWRAATAAAETAAAIASERERLLAASLTETQRRLTAHQEIANAAEARARAARRDAAAATAAAAGLREHAQALANRAGACDPAVADGGAAARAAGLVLADMLERVEARGREAAAALDAASGAGEACERAYQALNAKE